MNKTELKKKLDEVYKIAKDSRDINGMLHVIQVAREAGVHID